MRKETAVAVALVMLGAGAGHASLTPPPVQTICNTTPTVAQCTDPSYLAACPSQQTACNSVMTGTLSSYGASLPRQGPVYSPAGTNHAGTVQSARYAPYSYTNGGAFVSGLTGGYYGSVENHVAYVNNPSSNGTALYHYTGPGFPVLTYVDPQASWSTDGTTVNSCEEYIYKRYNSLSHLEDMMAPYSGDYPDLFLAIYYFGGPLLSNKAVTDESGNFVMSWAWPTRMQNLYLRLPFFNLPWRSNVYDPQVVNLFTYLSYGYYGGPNPVPVDDSTQFNLVENLITGDSADLLEKRYEEMKAFEALVAQRAEIWNDHVQRCAATSCNCNQLQFPANISCNLETLETQGALYTIDVQLNQKLMTAMTTPNESCFDFYNIAPTACTLSPHQVVDEMIQAIAPAREADYQECLRITANQFGAGSLMQLAQNGGLEPEGVYPQFGGFTQNSATLKMFFGLIERAVQSIQLPVDPSTGRVMLGDKASDEETAGNSNFRAGFSYDAGWSVTDVDDPQHLCNGNLHINGHVDVEATFFGTEHNIASISAKVDTTKTADTTSNIQYFEDFELLGNSIAPYPKSGSSTTSFDLTVANVDQTVGQSLQFPFFIGPIPVTITAGAQGGVGFQSSLDGSLSRDCSSLSAPLAISTAGSFAPYAHLDAFVQAGLGFSGVLEVGVGGALTLVRIDLPLTMGASVATDGKGGLTINGASNLDLKLTTFGGRLYVFLDSLVGSVEQTLVQWSGATVDTNLFHLNFHLPVALASLRLAGPGGESGALP
jgi:hypothetical protein